MLIKKLEAKNTKPIILRQLLKLIKCSWLSFFGFKLINKISMERNQFEKKKYLLGTYKHLGLGSYGLTLYLVSIKLTTIDQTVQTALTELKK